MALRKLLGTDHILDKKKKEVAVSSLEGKTMLLYFSAHWCPPCRQFTPMLAQLYKKLKGDPLKDEFDIIFVSSDDSEAEFASYYEEMPWLALPYALRKSKEKLSRKLKCSSIPGLYVVDPDGRPHPQNVARRVVQDSDGEDFPWVPKNPWELLKGASFVRSDASAEGPKAPVPSTEDLRKSCDAIGLYFSAHWSPPCRAFTPRLTSLYRKLKAKTDTKMEIILVPIDQVEEEFDEYFSEMPWLSLPSGDNRVQTLAESLNVKQVPTLVMIKSDGSVINDEAKDVADDDTTGALFPWAPVSLPGVVQLYPSAPVVNALNGDVCAILALNGATNKSTSLVEFTAAAKELEETVNAKVEAEKRIRFFTVDENDETQVHLYRKVLGASHAGAPTHGVSTVLLLCLPNKRAHKFIAGELSKANIVASTSNFHKANTEED